MSVSHDELDFHFWGIFGLECCPHYWSLQWATPTYKKKMLFSINFQWPSTSLQITLCINLFQTKTKSYRCCTSSFLKHKIISNRMENPDENMTWPHNDFCFWETSLQILERIMGLTQVYLCHNITQRLTVASFLNVEYIVRGCQPHFIQGIHV